MFDGHQEVENVGQLFGRVRALHLGKERVGPAGRTPGRGSCYSRRSGKSKPRPSRPEKLNSADAAMHLLNKETVTFCLFILSHVLLVLPFHQ